MMFIVATNVVASWPPENRPTGTPHARANKVDKIATNNHKYWSLDLFLLSIFGLTETNLRSHFYEERKIQAILIQLKKYFE